MKSRGFIVLNDYTRAEHEDDKGVESIVILGAYVDGYIKLSKKESIDLVGFVQELWREEFDL